MGLTEFSFVVNLIAAMSQSISPAYQVSPTTEQEVYCLAQNVYHEAQGESVVGKAGVALVSKNRVLHENYPSTYCDVVHQGLTHKIKPGSVKHNILIRLHSHRRLPGKDEWVVRYMANRGLIEKGWPPIMTRKGLSVLRILNRGAVWDTGIPIRNKCQFSWWCDGRSDKIRLYNAKGQLIKQNAAAWKDSVEVATLVVMGFLDDFTGGATHYYNPKKANPKWARNKKRFKPSPRFKNGTLENHRYMITLSRDERGEE